MEQQDRPLTWVKKQKLLRSFRKSLKVYERHSEALMTIRHNYQKLGMSIDESFLNVCNFCLFLLFDLGLATKNAIRSKTPLEHQHYARTLVVTIYAGTEFFNKKIGLHLAKNFLTSEVNEERFKVANRELNRVFDEFNAEFKSYRNQIGAHYELSLDSRMEKLLGLNINRILDYSIRIQNQFEILMKVWNDYLQKELEKLNRIEAETKARIL